MPPSSRADDLAAIRAELRSSLNEDPINLERLLGRIEWLSWDPGRGPHASLLLLLCHMICDEEEARGHWEGMLRRRAQIEQALGRPAALRVAILDYLVGLNRQTSRPLRLDLIQSHRAGDQEMTDPVTGLQTRRFLEDQVPREVARARRFKIDLSCVHIEIDDYARLTEEMGPAVGTLLLREMAGLIGGCIRNIDYAARLSGAQFGLLLTETDRMGAYYVAERIRQKVEEYYLERRVNGRPFGVTASAGVASFPEDADGAEDLARKACEASHTARARGAGRVAIYYRERREFIRLALENEDLQVTMIPEGDGRAAAGSMKNISSGGVLFESPAPIELGRMVRILCRSRRDAEQVQIPGRVVRIEKFESEAGERYEIGVLFDLVVEEQLEGVIEFLERFTAAPPGDDGTLQQPRAS